MSDTNNPVLQAIRERRSIRRYTDEPLTADEVRTLIDAGRWAPSGLNNQPWRFLAVLAGDPRKETLAGLTKYSHIVERAKALIVVLLDKPSMYHQIKDHQAGGAAVQNILLAAHSMGIGGVWLGEILKQERQVLEALGLDPDGYEMVAAVALGRPEQKGASSRKDLDDFLIEPL